MTLIDWLAGQSAAMIALEARARDLLRTGDMDAYRALMKEKASLLAALAGEAEPLLAATPEPLASAAREGVNEFSASARLALRIDSVFFMSALLYPEDHAQGEPNDLELLVEELRGLEGM